MKIPFFKPKQLFLIDALGAVVSAFMLGIILPMFESFFGMPKNILYLLAAIPCFFFCYSIWNYFQFKKKWQPRLKGIAIANLLYCCLTSILIFLKSEMLTGWSIAYFLIEILIIVILVTFEWKTVTSKPS